MDIEKYNIVLDRNSPAYLDNLCDLMVGISYRDDSTTHGAFDLDRRIEGFDYPVTAFSMIGQKRMKNIEYLAKDIIKNNIEGDFLEAGVWRGGACIFMAGIIKYYKEDRKVWVCDSFEGLPKPNQNMYPADVNDRHHTIRELSISEEQVKTNFGSCGLLDDSVVFAKGWFSETLPKLPVEKLALLRLDGDMYESTMDTLVNLYPKLSIGGYVVIDDYGLIPCREAIADYRKSHNIDSEIITIDHTGVYWKKLAS